MYLYDLLGRLVERRSPGYSGSTGALRWTYRYDGGGPLEKWKDGNGHVVFIDRDDNLLRGTTRRVEPNSSAVPLSLMTGEYGRRTREASSSRSSCHFFRRRQAPLTGIRFAHVTGSFAGARETL